MTQNTYQIVDENGNGLAEPSTAADAARLARRFAAEAGASVYIYTSDEGDYSPVEVTPGSDALAVEREILAMT